MYVYNYIASQWKLMQDLTSGCKICSIGMGYKILSKDHARKQYFLQDRSPVVHPAKISCISKMELITLQEVIFCALDHVHVGVMQLRILS